MLGCISASLHSCLMVLLVLRGLLRGAKNLRKARIFINANSHINRSGGNKLCRARGNGIDGLISVCRGDCIDSVCG